jgi:hypothetical protein
MRAAVLRPALSGFLGTPAAVLLALAAPHLPVQAEREEVPLLPSSIFTEMGIDFFEGY